MMARRAVDALLQDAARARVELEPGRFYAPEAFARIGQNFARGSYEHNLRTRDYRFLLEGRLRPLDIGGWFGPWWPAFFRQLGSDYEVADHAVCPLRDHAAPVADCSCGFYAVEGDEQLWRLGSYEPELVTLDVELAGRVIDIAVKELAARPKGNRAIVSICADGGLGSVLLLENA